MAQAAEKKITRTELPPAVQKAADAEAQGATARGYSTEVENGRREYEMEMMVNGHTRDVTFAADGNIIEIEQSVELDSLSPAVRSALRQRAGSGKILGVESLTKKGAIVAYEAKVARDGKRLEVQVGPDGQRLDHEE
ncbi:MAG TPA: hypothetical protein VGL22_02085 [Terracidiphilus sp.]|jgi:hypothetical protein